MNRNLIALAILATTGTAMAQSNVALYGRLDASLGETKLNGSTSKQLYSGNLTTSRWGMRGSEDLGGGLKANFQLETALSVVDGSSGAGFSRQSWVGLSGGFGSFKLGKADSVYKDIYDLGNTHNVFDSEFTATKEAFRAGLGNFTSRPNNQVRYDSPNFDGLSAGLTHSLHEDSATAPDISAIDVRYRTGSLDLGLAHQDEDSANLADDRKFTALTATYNFGMARVSALYQQVKAGDNRKDNELGLGVSIPIGSFDLSAGYGQSTSKSVGGGVAAKGKAFSLGATYALSKRTRTYAGYINGDTKNAVGVTTRKYSLFALGIRHDF